MALLAACRGSRLAIPVLCSVRLPPTALSSIPSRVVSSLPQTTGDCRVSLWHPYDHRHYASGSHSDSRHWSMERYVSASFLVLLPAAILAPSNPIVDYSLAVVLPLHGHWGIQQAIMDYVHGNAMNKFCNALLLAVSMGTFLGLIYLNYNDVGVSAAVAKLWSL
ncbi:succinate dehydrogenase [ubiquinone] cytochrome b small subunit A, mitochondrial-like isoform X2 [Dysidea avara]|uniref:succinate dehydrogenase [ubiquinone] cytochrome b small subunit A, mitochondrial-like isoform X2 n=1 Tax=Dysidea avara TaxID=196820 RepID=UPI003319B2B3